MAEKNSSEKEMNTRNNKQEVYGQVHYLNHFEQGERQRSEHERLQAEEVKLRKLKLFSCEPFDYSSLLEAFPWKEPPPADFSHLIDENRLAVEGKFLLPIVYRGGILLCLITLIIISKNAAVLWGEAGCTLIVSLSLVYVINSRQQALDKAKKDSIAEIQLLTELEHKRNENAKLSHDEAEQERTKNIQRLLEGSTEMIIRRLDEILPRIGFPFPVGVTFTIYENTVNIDVSLPAKTVIPRQLSDITPGGRVVYEDKTKRQLNKQYLEVCAGIIVRILCIVCANIPSFQKYYIAGVSKADLQDECVCSISANREAILSAVKADNPLTVLQTLKACFECDTNLNLLRVENEEPIEWKDIEKKLLSTVRFTLYR